MASRRPERVAEAIKIELTALLGRGLDDPRLAGVVVTRVRLSADLSRARVFVRSMGGCREPELLGGLRAASGRLRRGLAGRVSLAHVPELGFEYDRGPDHRQRVEQILREIAEEPKAPDV